MGLQWIRLDTTFADHPKILALVADRAFQAVTAHLMAMTYSGKHGTDGYVPRAALPFIHARKADAERLVGVGLWHETSGGWEINGWDEYQVSDEAAKTRKARAKKGGCIKNHGPNCGCWQS